MPFASPASFSLVSNLVSLPHGAAKGIGHAGTAATAYVDDVCSPIFVSTGATVTSQGVIILYIVTAEELTNWTDGINPDAVITQHTKITDATQQNVVQRIGQGANVLTPSTSYCFGGFSVKSLLGFSPTFWAPLIWNLSGGALSATASDFYAKHTIIT